MLGLVIIAAADVEHMLFDEIAHRSRPIRGELSMVRSGKGQWCSMNPQMLGCPELATFRRAATSAGMPEDAESSTLMATDCPVVEEAATKTLPVAPFPKVLPEKT